MNTVPEKPTVFVVDDDSAVRQALAMLMQAAGHPVKTCVSPQEFLESYDPSRSGCLILDVRMPGMTGLELQQKLVDAGAALPMILITGHGDVPMAVQAVKKGAVDFLLKPFDDELLLDRVAQAIELDARRRVEQQRKADVAARLARLSPREREVMDLLVTGLGNKEIALKLGLSRKTVDIHRAHVMMKLRIDSVAELVRLGLIHKPDSA